MVKLFGIVKRRSYTIEYKSSVIQQANATSVPIVAALHKLPIQTIYKWMYQKMQIFSQDKKRSRRKVKKTRASVKHHEIEEELYQYIKEARGSGAIISTRIAIQKMKEIKPSLESLRYEALLSWFKRFRLRYNIVNRRVTASTTSGPKEIKENVTSFYKTLTNLRSIVQYPLANIVNMDQTYISFDSDDLWTLDIKGVSKVSYKRPKIDFQATRITILLTAAADGTKGRPLVIFKGNPQSITKTEAINLCSEDAHCTVQENAWTDASVLLEWFHEVYMNMSLQNNNLLFLDEFRCHKEPKFLRLLKESGNTDVCYIKAGFTGILQPMDIGIIKPFKDRLRHLYHTWSAKNQEQRVNKCLVTEWVINAWNEVNPDIIKNSFRRIGIGEDLNVTEDEFLRNVLDLNSKKRRKKNIAKEFEEHDKSLQMQENDLDKLSSKDKKFILRQIKDELEDGSDPSLGIKRNEMLF